jgi:arsenate reductase (thioredoxin)
LDKQTHFLKIQYLCEKICRMYTPIRQRCQALINNFQEIPKQRKQVLEELSIHLKQVINLGEPVQLNFICTHNSRRSHLGQVWAAVAAHFYNIPSVYTFSGGSQATSFNLNAIKALESAGFKIEKTNENSNPTYHVWFGHESYVTCFSKTFDHEQNPKNNFVAVMTCTDADENCPLIAGCDLRVSTTYFDPKSFDGSILQDEKYTERSNQIAMECLYVFYKIFN